MVLTHPGLVEMGFLGPKVVDNAGVPLRMEDGPGEACIGVV